MKIFNGKDCQMTIPLLGTSQMLELGPKQVSKDLMPTVEFLELITRCFSPKDIAIILAGPFEYNVCANIPLISNFTCLSLDEAVSRFTTPAPEEPVIDDAKVEEEVKETNEVPEQPVEKIEEVEEKPEKVSEAAEENKVVEEVKETKHVEEKRKSSIRRKVRLRGE